MAAVLWAQWRKERRSPYITLLFIALSVVAVMLFGMNTDNKMKIDVFAGPGVSAAEAERWIEKLNESETFVFVAEEERKARAEVSEGRSTLAVQLLPDNYRIIAAVEGYNIQLAEHHLSNVFRTELELRAAAELMDDPDQFREDLAKYMEQPALTLQVSSPEGGALVSYNMNLQLMFAFALFLVMFTVGFKINAINAEKTSGIWNRMILSPVTKTQMYLGHLIFSSAIGFLQILIVYLVFRYGFGFPLGERFGMLLLVTAVYTIAIVALAMLFAGISRTPEQFYMIYPMVMPIMPVVSGAYMPPGTITNAVLLWIAEALPLTHAMDALIDISLYGAGWNDIFPPLAKLLLIAVLCMGVGINLVERGRR